MFCLLACTLAIVTFIQKLTYSYTSENLIFTIRRKLFEGIIYKDISWFDSKDRAPGVLTNIVSEDISLLNGLTTETISIIMQGLFGLSIGIILSFYFSWRMALITLAISPMMALGGFLKKSTMNKEIEGTGKEESKYKESNALLSDIIMNYRTVIGFGPKNIRYLLKNYETLLEIPNAKGVRNAHIGGLAYGYTNCTRYIFQGLIFYLSSLIIFKYHETAEDVYISVYLMLMSALGSGMQI
jgi:ATP-binding cassette subfamily B (MDR/TAP) protein 1